MDAIERVKSNFIESIKLKNESIDRLAVLIVQAADLMATTILQENKVLSCGNAASAAEAQRFSSLMLNRFDIERPGLPAVALTCDAPTMTSIANDYQYADIFSKQIRALGQPGDILLAITSSGESHSIIHAIDAAHDRDMNVVALTGREGGQAAHLMQNQDIEIRVTHWTTARIQEVHIMIIHSLCDLIDQQLLGQEIT